jgi:hypothetical protein
MSEPLVAQATSLSRKKALIVNAFPQAASTKDDVQDRLAFYRKVRQQWRAKGINTTLWESNITPYTLLQLNKYDFVIIATHGARYSYWAGPKRHRKLYTISGLCITQKWNDRVYTKALKDRQLVKRSYGYLVLPKYLRSHYKPGAFKKVVLGLESCTVFGDNSRIDTTLPGVFTQKGATAAVGFLNVVSAGYGRNFVKAFAESMFEGKDVGASMSAAMNKVGKTQRDWWTKNSKKPYPYTHDTFPRYVGIKTGKLV